MKLIVNGQAEDLPEEITIKEFVGLKGLNPATIIIEYNYKLVKKDEWDNIVLKPEDNLEILAFVGGG